MDLNKYIQSIERDNGSQESEKVASTQAPATTTTNLNPTAATSAPAATLTPTAATPISTAAIPNPLENKSLQEINVSFYAYLRCKLK